MGHHTRSPGRPTLRTLELRRHAQRDPVEDRLSPEGRATAEEVGRTLAGSYSAIFSSPAQRTAETAAWFLRGRHEDPPAHHAVVAGLAGTSDEDRTPAALARVVEGLLSDVPEGGRGLAVGHTPLIERAVLGLTGREIAPLAECEGVLLVEVDDGAIHVSELRLGA